MTGEGGLKTRVIREGTIHLVGIGGAGMSGLARLLVARGATVSGCDRRRPDHPEDLAGAGITVTVGHDPGHVEGVDAVIFTAAVPADHPELEAARAGGIPVVKRSRALGDLVNDSRLVAVAGTHGKTTTTALTALALEAASGDPTALVGGRIPEWAGNARVGDPELSVVEADEYDRAFLDLRPTVAVVTSVEAEHLDTYGSADEMERAFDRFVEQIRPGGRLVACVDDPGARRRLERVDRDPIGYGFREGAPLRAVDLETDPGGSRFTLVQDGRERCRFELALPGRHNVLNALAALGALIALGHEPSAARSAFRSFRGVERRFQVLGTAGGVTVVDDYAHHPTEVLATLQAARQAFAARRLVAAFQPHLYSRTRAFRDRFGAVLAGADRVYVTAIYPAREDPIPGVTGRGVAEAAEARAGSGVVTYVESLDQLIQELRAELRSGDVLLTLGAGDIDRVARQVLTAFGRTDVET